MPSQKRPRGVCLECGKPRAILARGLCNSCYKRVKHRYPKLKETGRHGTKEPTAAELETMMAEQSANLPDWWYKEIVTEAVGPRLTAVEQRGMELAKVKQSLRKTSRRST